VKLPLTAERLQELCYSDLNSTASERAAVVTGLLAALHHLEASVGSNSTVRKTVEGGGGDWMGQYMIKREFSEGSYHVFGIVIPDLRLEHAAEDQSAGSQMSHDEEACPKADLRSTQSDKDRSAESVMGNDEDVCHNPDAATLASRHRAVQTATRLFHKGQGLVRPLVPEFLSHLRPVAKLLGTSHTRTGGHISENSTKQSCSDPITSHSDPQPSGHPNKGIKDAHAETANSQTAVHVKPSSNVTLVQDVLPDPSTGGAIGTDILLPADHHNSHQRWQPSGTSDNDYAPKHDLQNMDSIEKGHLPADLASLLDVTADRLLRESCGEGWLLQPRIADMTRLEYRVYLLGGARAASPLLGSDVAD